MKSDSNGWTRRRVVGSTAMASFSATSGLPWVEPAFAADVARADTFIITGQPSGGSPTFSQYNDFNVFRPSLDRRSSITQDRKSVV